MFNKKYATPDGLQCALVVSAVAFYVVGFLQTIQLFAQQAPTNSNFSGFMPLLLWQIVPVAFLALAYFLNPRKKLTQVQRMFEAVVLTTVGVLMFHVISQIAVYLMNLGSMVGSDMNFLAYEVSMMVIMTAIFGGVLWFLARSKRWK